MLHILIYFYVCAIILFFLDGSKRYRKPVILNNVGPNSGWVNLAAAYTFEGKPTKIDWIFVRYQPLVLVSIFFLMKNSSFPPSPTINCIYIGHNHFKFWFINLIKISNLKWCWEKYPDYSVTDLSQYCCTGTIKTNKSTKLCFNCRFWSSSH